MAKYKSAFPVVGQITDVYAANTLSQGHPKCKYCGDDNDDASGYSDDDDDDDNGDD